ncbi:MAG: hypothetical protein ACRDJM_02920, partial [Actinomycetota bacterium]
EIEGGPNDADAGTSYGTPDFSCTVLVGATTCSGNYTPTTANVDLVRAFIHHSGANRTTEPDATEGVNETLQPGATTEPDVTDAFNVVVTGSTQPAQLLDCDDEQPSGSGGDDHATNPTTGDTATTHETFTCRVTAAGAGVPNVVVDMENLTAGVNDGDAGKVGPPDFTCTTGPAGTCTIDVPTATGVLATGTALFCGWIDSPADDVVDDTNANNGGGCTEPVDATESDNSTDVMEVMWQDRVTTTVNIVNEDDARVLPVQNNHTVNIQVLDQFLVGVGGVNVDFYIIGGPNRNTGPVVSRDCNSAADGTCAVTYPSGGANGIDQFCAWRDIAPTDVYEPAGASGDGGSCGTEPSAPDADGGDPFTDRGQVTWSGGVSIASQLEVAPEVAPGGSVAEGTEYGLTATVKDENGNPMNAQSVNFELTGAGDPDGDTPNTPDRVCVTAASGTCTLEGAPGAIGSSTTFTSNTSGTTNVMSWVAGQSPDTAEGPDAGPAPDEPAGSPDVPGGSVEPDTTDDVTVRWGRITTSLTNLVLSPRIGVYGIDPRATGKLMGDDGNPVADAQLLIKRRSVGSTNTFLVGSPTTGPDGSFTFTDNNPPASADYTFEYGGDADHLPVSSGPMRVSIRPGVIFNVSPTALPRNRAATLSGQVVPGHAGKRVTLQLFDGANQVWRNVRTIPLDANSRYRFSYTKNSAGALLFRIAYLTQDVDHLWNVSRNMRIQWT